MSILLSMATIAALPLSFQAAMSLQGITLVEPPKADASGMAAEYGSGVCRITVFGKDGNGDEIRAQFSRRLRDGNLALQLSGRFIQEYRGKDTNENHPVTVKFDTINSAPSRSGGYDTGGFREYVWGGWGAGAASDATYAQLKDASAFTIAMDGKSFGPFTWVGKGAVYKAMDACEDDNS